MFPRQPRSIRREKSRAVAYPRASVAYRRESPEAAAYTVVFLCFVFRLEPGDRNESSSKRSVAMESSKLPQAPLHKRVDLLCRLRIARHLYGSRVTTGGVRIHR